MANRTPAATNVFTAKDMRSAVVGVKMQAGLSHTDDLK
jgi:hypothetical protein